MSKKEVKTYSAGAVKVVIGTHLVSGVAADTFLNIEPIGEGTQSESGAYGDVARSLSLDQRYNVTLTLQQTSASNAALSAQYALDQATDGDGAQQILITDLRGGTIFNGTCWIPRLPASPFGATTQNREWVIEAVADYFVGGN